MPNCTRLIIACSPCHLKRHLQQTSSQRSLDLPRIQHGLNRSSSQVLSVAVIFQSFALSTVRQTEVQTALESLPARGTPVRISNFRRLPCPLRLPQPLIHHLPPHHPQPPLHHLDLCPAFEITSTRRGISSASTLLLMSGLGKEERARGCRLRSTAGSLFTDKSGRHTPAT